VDRFFAYAHCQPVLKSGATWIAKSDVELLESLRLALRNRSAKQVERRELLRGLVGFTDGQTHERWVAALRQLAHQETIPVSAPAR
jgi:hypothetical protein